MRRFLAPINPSSCIDRLKFAELKRILTYDMGFLNLNILKLDES